MATEKTVYAQGDQIFATKLMHIMGAGVTKELSNFSSWMIAGAAAMFAVVLNGASELNGWLVIPELGYSLKLFLVAAGLNVLQRWLGAITGASVAAGAQAEKMVTPGPVNGAAVLQMIEDSAWWPVSYFAKYSMNKIKAGDYLFSGTLVARLSQAQAWLVIVQMVLLVIAGWRLLP